MPVESCLEFGAVVGLDDFDFEGQSPQDVVDELDGGLLIALRVDPQHAQPSAVVDRGELVVLAPPPRSSRGTGRAAGSGAGRAAGGGAGCGGGQRFDELDVDLDPVAGLLFFVALPLAVAPLVALRGGQPVETRRLRMRQTPDLLTATSW